MTDRDFIKTFSGLLAGLLALTVIIFVVAQMVSGSGKVKAKTAQTDSDIAARIKPVGELAISLHGATDEVRSQIMPVNRKYPLAVLLEACAFYTERKKQWLTFEYILIGGVNDRPEDAAALVRLARKVKAKINCIPYNKVEGLDWKRPSEARQDAFMAVLAAARIPATLRREKGHDIAAACGQLRRQTLPAVA